MDMIYIFLMSDKLVTAGAAPFAHGSSAEITIRSHPMGPRYPRAATSRSAKAHGIGRMQKRTVSRYAVMQLALRNISEARVLSQYS